MSGEGRREISYQWWIGGVQNEILGRPFEFATYGFDSYETPDRPRSDAVLAFSA